VPPRKQQDRPQFVQALESFLVDHEDVDTGRIDRNDLVRRDHPVVKQNPTKFGEARIRFQRSEVEQATAAPGEKRGDR
jgi:hypothetical protein